MRERARFEQEVRDLELENPSPDLWKDFDNIPRNDSDAKASCGMSLASLENIDGRLVEKVVEFQKWLNNITVGGKPLSMKLNSCYRDQDKQAKMHYARMIRWSIDDIKRYVLVANKDPTGKVAQQIKQNATKLFIPLEGLPTNAAPQKINEKAKAEYNGSRPVAAWTDNCPCGCGWPRSKHTLGTAVDANIYLKDDVIVNANSTPNSSELTQLSDNGKSLYEEIKQASKDSDLEWGIDWIINNPPYLPADAIHWELEPSIYPQNPGPLPSWDLRNREQGGDGPVFKGDPRKDLVKLLQEMLIALGYNLGSTRDDGIFGSMTGLAIEDYQSSHTDFNDNPLTADTLVGPLTADSLNRTMVGKWYGSYISPKLLVLHYEEVRKGKKVLLPDSP